MQRSVRGDWVLCVRDRERRHESARWPSGLKARLPIHPRQASQQNVKE